MADVAVNSCTKVNLKDPRLAFIKAGQLIHQVQGSNYAQLFLDVNSDVADDDKDAKKLIAKMKEQAAASSVTKTGDGSGAASGSSGENPLAIINEELTQFWFAAKPGTTRFMMIAKMAGFNFDEKLDTKALLNAQEHVKPIIIKTFELIIKYEQQIHDGLAQQQPAEPTAPEFPAAEPAEPAAHAGAGQEPPPSAPKWVGASDPGAGAGASPEPDSMIDSDEEGPAKLAVKLTDAPFVEAATLNDETGNQQPEEVAPAAGAEVDILKAENEALRQALAQSEAEKVALQQQLQALQARHSRRKERSALLVSQMSQLATDSSDEELEVRVLGVK